MFPGVILLARHAKYLGAYLIFKYESVILTLFRLVDGNIGLGNDYELRFEFAFELAIKRCHDSLENLDGETLSNHGRGESHFVILLQ